MKRITLNIITLFLLLNLYGQTVLENTRQKIVSPNGKYIFEFYQKEFAHDVKQMYYTISYDGKSVVEESELGVLIENRLF